MNMTYPHIGIIITIIGTILLAFSLRIQSQFGLGTFVDEAGDIAVVPNDGEEDTKKAIFPTYTYINKWLFWGGLFLVAVGSLLQW
jgi:hypothetical protein